MSVLGRLALALLGGAVLLVAGPLHAQDLDTGKSGERLFAANCASCHRTPRGLAKQSSMFLSRQMIEDVEGNDRIEGARWELKLHHIGAKQLGARHVRLCEVDLRLGDIHAYRPV